MYTVTLIPGDGIGPEIVQSATRVVSAAGVNIQWESQMAGRCAISEYGHPVGDHVLESIKKNRTALKGPLTNVFGSEFPGPNGYLRKKLGLFANLRLAKSFPGVKSYYQNVNLAVVRETTEDVYRGQEQMIGEDVAVGIKFITRQGTRRVVRFAFDFAIREGRKKVTVVLKAMVLKLTDGLFLREARNVAQEYPQVEFEEMNVDAQCLELVRKPATYDVLVMPNLYGDIIADLAGGLVGSVGICPGVNYGDGIAVFEPAHGSAPKYAGLNKVNPTAMILSAAMLVRYLGEKDQAVRIEKAVAAVLKEGKTVTYDLGGTAGTTQMTDAIIDRLNS